MDGQKLKMRNFLFIMDGSQSGKQVFFSYGRVELEAEDEFFFSYGRVELVAKDEFFLVMMGRRQR